MTDPSPPREGQSQQIRGSSLLLVGTLLGSALDFFGLVILVRYLSKGDFGAWSYALAIITLLASIAQLEMRNVVARFIPVYLERRQTDKVGGAIALALSLALGVGAVLAFGLAVGITALGIHPTSDPEALRLMVLLALLIPMQAVDSIFTGLFAAFGASRAIFLRQSILAPALRLGLITTLIVLGTTVDFLAIGYVVATVIGVLLYAWAFARLLRRSRPAAVSRTVSVPTREILTFAGPLLTSTLVWALMESSDALLLGYFWNAESVASLRVVFPLARMNAIVAGVFAILYLPLAARAVERSHAAELNETYWRTTLWMTLLTFPILLLTFSFARPVTIGLFGPDYADSAPMLAILAVGYFFHTALGFNGLTVKVFGRLRYTMAIDIGMAFVNIVVNLALIPRFGAIGAAIGTSSTLILHNVLKHSALAKFTPVRVFHGPYLRVYAGMLAVALLLLLVQRALPESLALAVLTAGVVGLVALWLSRGLLEIDRFFPEFAAVRPPSWLSALLRNGARPPDPADAEFDE
jgi:O-antigen/teichoic acid export membrane protein